MICIFYCIFREREKMPDKCSVKNYKRKIGEKVAMFSPPKAEALLHKLKKALWGLTKKPLQPSSKVCAKNILIGIVLKVFTFFQ